MAEEMARVGSDGVGMAVAVQAEMATLPVARLANRPDARPGHRLGEEGRPRGLVVEGHSEVVRFVWISRRARTRILERTIALGRRTDTGP